MRWIVNAALIVALSACVSIGNYSSVASEHVVAADSLIVAITGLGYQQTLAAEQELCQRLKKNSELAHCVSSSALIRPSTESPVDSLHALAERGGHSHSLHLTLATSETVAPAHRVMVHQYPLLSLIYQAEVEASTVAEGRSEKYQQALFKHLAEDIAVQAILPGQI